MRQSAPAGPARLGPFALKFLPPLHDQPRGRRPCGAVARLRDRGGCLSRGQWICGRRGHFGPACCRGEWGLPVIAEAGLQGEPSYFGSEIAYTLVRSGDAAINLQNPSTEGASRGVKWFEEVRHVIVGSPDGRGAHSFRREEAPESDSQRLQRAVQGPLLVPAAALVLGLAVPVRQPPGVRHVSPAVRLPVTRLAWSLG